MTQTIATKGRVRISRRLPAEGNAVLVIGQERFQVPMVDVGLCGMCVLTPKSLPHGLDVVMEVSEPYGVDAYACRVAFCQEISMGWQIGLEIVQQDAKLLVIDIP